MIFLSAYELASKGKIMTIANKDIVTEVCRISSLYQLLDQKEQLGEPCLIMIFVDSKTVLGSNDTEKAAVRDLLANAPFMSAVVSDDEICDELSSAADFVLKASNAQEYTEKLFKDKTKKQIAEITACFTAARKGSAEDVLNVESRAFYRLMADKNGGNSNE